MDKLIIIRTDNQNNLYEQIISLITANQAKMETMCRQPPLTVIRAILSGQTGTSPAINRYAAKGSLHE